MSLATVTLFAQYVGRHKKILTVRHTAPQVPVPVIRHWARLPSLLVHFSYSPQF